MKNPLKPLLPVLFICFLMITAAQAQSFTGKPKIWDKSQLIEPTELMALLKNTQVAQPIIYNIGFVNDIPKAKNMGAAKDRNKLADFKKVVKKLPKNSFIVIYCGCCPFEKCPNVRPAYTFLKDVGFTRARILNLPTSLKADWIDKGYPLAKIGDGK